MKNATKHADSLKSLCKKLVKEHKPAARESMDPLRALVRAAMSFDVPDAKADEAMKVIDREFVDLNELRVATDLELQEMLGTRYPQIELRVEMIAAYTAHIFETQHTLNLDKLRELSKKDARQLLRDIPDVHPFVEAYVAMFAFDGHAFPVDETMLGYLKEEGMVEPETTLLEAQKFIENTLKAEDCYEFFRALRSSSIDSAKAIRKK